LSRYVARAPGCLWVLLALLALLVVFGAAGVGLDATILLVPMSLIPAVLAIMVFIAGERLAVLVSSGIAGLIYAGLGAWNYIRAEEFEAANPRSVDISGGWVSIALLLIGLAAFMWSAVLVVVRVRSRRASP
jgi:hypothetical protein